MNWITKIIKAGEKIKSAEIGCNRLHAGFCEVCAIVRGGACVGVGGGGDLQGCSTVRE